MSTVLNGEFTELKLTECGRERCNPNKDIVSDVKMWHTIHYVLYGKGTFILENNTYSLEKGDIFCIPKGHASRYYPDKNDPWVYVWVGIEGSFADEFLKKVGFLKDKPIIKDDKKSAIKGFFNELADCYNESTELNLSCMSVALKIFNEMLGLNSGRTLFKDIKASHVHEAKQFISNNYQFNISVTDIASSIGLTPNYLANIFKEVLKTTPKQYLINYRINKACYYLSGDKMPIKEVANKVGYANQLHFSAEFKRVKKVSPQAYQTKNRLWQ